MPGIASNLLAERLRGLESAALIARHYAPPPVGATLISLTDRGQDLSGVVRELTRWGAPLMFDAPDNDAFRVHWFSLPLRYLCRDGSPDEPATTVRFGDLQDGCDVIAERGQVDVRPCSADRRPDATVDAPPRVLVEVLTGQVTLRTARARGLVIEGSAAALERVLPEGGIDG